MKQCIWIALGWTALFFVAGAAANDSIARVGAGGLTLLKTDQIQMVQEELQISPGSVKVHYRFLNETGQDIKTTVAFPMPPYGFNPGFSESRLNEGPLESFRISVGGHEIPTKMSRVALVGSLDVTQQLRKVGLSDKQIFETFGDCRGADDGGTVICGIADEKRAEIVRYTGNSSWQVAETAYWEQVFPARKEIEVSHEYQPFVGRSYAYSGIPGDAKESCMDHGTQSAIAKNIDSLKAKGGDAVVSLDVVEYILGTGRNWKGPIKDFKLILKKDSPNQIVSLCFPGKAKRTSASTIEFAHSDFVPQDKIIVYFYTVATEVLAPPDER